VAWRGVEFGCRLRESGFQYVCEARRCFRPGKEHEYKADHRQIRWTGATKQTEREEKEENIEMRGEGERLMTDTHLYLEFQDGEM
jgi:hypothetical protein